MITCTKAAAAAAAGGGSAPRELEREINGLDLLQVFQEEAHSPTERVYQMHQREREREIARREQQQQQECRRKGEKRNKSCKSESKREEKDCTLSACNDAVTAGESSGLREGG